MAHRRFLNRPFWRDWVLAAVFIGIGFELSSPGAPLAGWPGLFVIGIGAIIFITAIVHTIWAAMERRGISN